MSKQQITGTLEKAFKNPKGFWSILVDGVWYGTYKDDYSHLENQTVTFEGEQKGQYWNAGKVVASAPAQQARAGGSPAPMSPDARQSSIVLQSSYKSATELLGSLIVAGKADIGTKKADVLDITKGLLDDLAVHIYSRCIDPSDFLSSQLPPNVEIAGDDDDYNPMEA